MGAQDSYEAVKRAIGELARERDALAAENADLRARVGSADEIAATATGRDLATAIAILQRYGAVEVALGHFDDDERPRFDEIARTLGATVRRSQIVGGDPGDLRREPRWLDHFETYVSGMRVRAQAIGDVASEREIAEQRARRAGTEVTHAA